MAKRTILKLVQLLSEKIQGDDITTLGETTEAVELQNILELAYQEVLNRPANGWEFTRNRPRQLDSREVGDTQLCRLVIPSDVRQVQQVMYLSEINGVDKPSELTYRSPVDFLNMVIARNSADANVSAIATDDGVTLNIYTDRAPRYWTSFEEDYIYFDAYDSARSAGVVAADTVILAVIMPVTDFSDPTATLAVPESLENMIFYQAVAEASMQLRQTQDLDAERKANRQYIKQSALARTVIDRKVINYGR